MLLRKKSLKRKTTLNKKFDEFEPKSENMVSRSHLFTKLTLATTLTLSFLLLSNGCKQEISKNKLIKKDTTYVNEISPEPPTLPPKRENKTPRVSDLPPEGL